MAVITAISKRVVYCLAEVIVVEFKTHFLDLSVSAGCTAELSVTEFWSPFPDHKRNMSGAQCGWNEADSASFL
jgi:hypothetical protein